MTAAAVRTEAPTWLQQILPALVEFHRRFEVSGEVIPDGFTRWWSEEKKRWCEEHGCLRRDKKSCEEAGSRQCYARRMAST